MTCDEFRSLCERPGKEDPLVYTRAERWSMMGHVEACPTCMAECNRALDRGMRLDQGKTIAELTHAVKVLIADQTDPEVKP